MAGLAALEFAQALQQLVRPAVHVLCAAQRPWLAIATCYRNVAHAPLTLSCARQLLSHSPLTANRSPGGRPASGQDKHGRQRGGVGDGAQRQPQWQVGGLAMWQLSFLVY